MKRKLTADEFNVVLKYTERTHIDTSFDIYDYSESDDKFIDYENGNVYMGLQEGFCELYDAIAYPLIHDLDNFDECLLLRGLLLEFNAVTDEESRWLLNEDKG